MSKFYALLVIAIFLFSGKVVGSHPHSFIDNTITYVFNDNKITGIEVNWLFDELYSQTIISDIDKNKNKKFDPDEVKTIQNGYFTNLKNFNYFASIKIGKENLNITSVKNFNASIKKGVVNYSFLIPFDKPVDPLKTPILTSFYDKNYFIHVYFNEKNPVKYKGTKTLKCSHKLYEDTTTSYYFGMLNPEQIKLICK